MIILTVLLVLQAIASFLVDPSATFRESGWVSEQVTQQWSYHKIKHLNAFLDRTRGQEISLVLGSSRVMIFGPDEQQEEISTFYNAGIVGASAEDGLAFTKYILEQPDINVARVYINADFYYVIPDADYGARIRGVYQLESQLPENISLTGKVENYTGALISDDWIKALFTDSGNTPRLLRQVDWNTGYLIEDQVFISDRFPTQKDRIEATGTKLPIYVHSAELDMHRVELFRETVNRWTANGTEVVLLHMPYYPAALERILRYNMGDVLPEVDALDIDIAEHPLVAYCNFIDSGMLGLGGDEYWWDFGHSTRSAGIILWDDAQTCASEQLAG